MSEEHNRQGAIPPLHEKLPGVSSAPVMESRKSKGVAVLPIFLTGLLVILILVAGGIFSFRKYMAHQATEKAKEAKQDSDARKERGSGNVNFIDSLKAQIAQREARRQQDEAEAQRQADALKQKQQPPQATQATALPPPAAVTRTSTGGASASGHHEVTPAERKLLGDVVMNTGSGGGASTAASTGAAKDGLDDDLTPSDLAAGSASILPDQHYLLARGTIIPCVLESKIVSTYKGMTKCQITEDVYSSDGSVLLFERGSTITGEQRKAMMQGQAKIFVLWSQVRTPNGIVANVNSPGTDTLGATGQDAWVDSHWWDRFGNGIILSVIDDALQTAVNSAQNTGSNNNISYDNSSNTAESMATEALRNSINIPPTAYTNQGALLNVFVSRDIDFREVYSVR